MNLNQIAIPAKDIRASKEFYLTLGCVLIVDTPHYVRLKSPEGESTFSLIKEESDFYQGAVIYFETESLDETVDTLVSAGLEFEQLAEDKPYLWREAALYDPSGNKLKLYWAGENRLNPPWRVTDRGVTGS